MAIDVAHFIDTVPSSNWDVFSILRSVRKRWLLARESSIAWSAMEPADVGNSRVHFVVRLVHSAVVLESKEEGMK